MRPPAGIYNEFGELFYRLCQRAKTTPYAVGVSIGVNSKSWMSYAMRRNDHRTRFTTLPTKTLIALARAVGASADETSQLVILGLKEHAHPDLREYIVFLEQDNQRLRKKHDLPPPRYTFQP